MIYLIGALAIGFLSGLVFEYFIDVKMVQDAQKENKVLRLELAEAKKVQKVEHVQTIEIVDNRRPKDVQFGGF